MTRHLGIRQALILGVGILVVGRLSTGVTIASPSLENEGAQQSYKARAAQGLAISPVPLQIDHLNDVQKAEVGIGSYIVNAASDCAGCHSGPAGFLSGGNPFFLDRAGHVVWTRNLTPDSETGLHLSLDQFKEALRTGRDFHPGNTVQLIVMPWTTLRWGSDADLEAIYAYLQVIPPVSNAVPPDNKNDLPLPASTDFPKHDYTDGDVVRKLKFDRSSFDARRGLEISARPEPAGLDDDTRAAYGLGAYIASTFTHCNDCHTHPDRTADFTRINTEAFLTGGTVFAVPPPLQPLFRQVRTMSANLKGAEHGFFFEPGATWETFRAIIHTGTHADETPPRPLAFPMNLVAANLSNLLEDDLRAVYTWARLLVPTTGAAADQERQTYARWCAADADCLAGETCFAPTHECVGGPCSGDAECGACQVCGGNVCEPPPPDSACVASAQ